jgi:zinc protease
MNGSPRLRLSVRSVVSLLFVLSALSSAFPIRRDTLSNGLAILTSEDHHLPTVNLLLSVRAGSFNDPVGQEGLASLTAGLLTMGTQTRSADQIAEEIEFAGGELGSGADADHSTIGIQVLAKDLDPTLDLLADIVLNPVFSDSELAKLKRRTVAGLRRVEDDPPALLDREFNRLLYQSHPYGHPTSGYDSTVSQVSRDQVVGFYRTWFKSNNCYVVAAGDFASADLVAKLAARFGSWPRGPVPAIVAPPVPHIARPTGRVITRPEMNQARILIGHEGPPEGTADAYPLRLMNFVLGGSVFSSKIGAAIRRERGLAYDARSGFDRRLYGGSFRASTETKTDSAPTAIALILQQLRDIRAKGVTPDELRRTKDFYLGNFPLQFESARDRVGMLDRIELFHLGLDYVDRAPANVRAVTEAQILQAAHDRIFPDRYLIVVIGNLTEGGIKIPGIEWIEEP